MRCLAIQQPWAWLICAGFKRIENRTWSTPHRGRIAIVASSKQTEARRALKEFQGGRLPADLFTFSAVIGTADLTDVLPLSADLEEDPFASGPYCFVLERPKLFQTPIPTSGKLNLYNATTEEAERITAEEKRPGRVLDKPVYAEFARTLEGDPFDRILGFAEQYLDNGQWTDLERVTAKLLTLRPDQPQGYFCRANLAYVEDRFQDALADCNKAIKLAPDWGRAYFGRSDVYEALGDAKAAAADRAKALELDPGLSDALADRESDE